MIGKSKKPATVTRSPHVGRTKQSAFQYSSNRNASERKKRDQTVATGDVGNPKTLSKFRDVLSTVPYFIGVTAFIIISIGASLVLSAPKLELRSDTEPIRPVEQYQEVISKTIGNGLLSHTKLTIDRQKISESLQQTFPELQNIEVTTPIFGSSVVVNADTTRPVAVLTSRQGSYVLDSRGVALYNPDKTSNLQIITDQSDVRIQIGKPALSAAQMSFIAELKHQAAAAKLPIETMTLTAGGGELDVKHEGQPFFVKYNLYEKARPSFGTFLAAMEENQRRGVKPTEYIDVRVSERAYTK